MAAMWSIGGRIVDIYDDPGLKTLASSRYFGKVANLSMDDPSKISGLDDRQFGVVFITKQGEAIRKYPLHDLTNTVLSNVYFDLSGDRLPPEAKVVAATQIKEACSIFSVQPTPAVEKYAADGSFEGRNYIRMDSVREADKGSPDLLTHLTDEYVANRDKYTRQDRMDLAAAMAPMAEKFAFEMPADLKPFVLKDPVVDDESFFQQCSLRKQALAGDGNATRLLDEFFEKRATFDAKETIKLLETFDREYLLDRHWEKGLEPYSILAEKVAWHDVPIRNDFSRVKDEDFKRFVGSNDTLIRGMFGDDLADKVKKDPSSIWNLPSASQKFIAARIEQMDDKYPADAI